MTTSARGVTDFGVSDVIGDTGVLRFSGVFKSLDKVEGRPPWNMVFSVDEVYKSMLKKYSSVLLVTNCVTSTEASKFVVLSKGWFEPDKDSLCFASTLFTFFESTLLGFPLVFCDDPEELDADDECDVDDVSNGGGDVVNGWKLDGVASSLCTRPGSGDFVESENTQNLCHRLVSETSRE